MPAGGVDFRAGLVDLHWIEVMLKIDGHPGEERLGNKSW